MDADGRVGTAVDPAQVLAQLLEDPIHLAQTQVAPETPPPGADEEWRVLLGREVAVAQTLIPPQCLRRTGMQRDVAGLVELRLPHRQQARMQIDIRLSQVHRLGDAQARCRQQAEQGLVGGPAQIRFKTPGGGQQIADFLLGEDMRGRSPADGAEDRAIGYLGAWLELLQPAGKGTQLLQPPRPSGGIIAVGLGAPRPCGHHFNVDRSGQIETIDIACEAPEGQTCAAQVVSEPAAFGQIILDARLHRDHGVHASPPGYGRATAERLRPSSLA